MYCPPQRKANFGRELVAKIFEDLLTYALFAVSFPVKGGGATGKQLRPCAGLALVLVGRIASLGFTPESIANRNQETSH